MKKVTCENADNTPCAWETNGGTIVLNAENKHIISFELAKWVETAIERQYYEIYRSGFLYNMHDSNGNPIGYTNNDDTNAVKSLYLQ